ncbi:MAG TPA: flagellar hook-associated protein FlgK [Chthonomonadaceae bacterium]|nr:flagellar hook-associated protein FlgK [Chthonomonadaceae bacterium]
MPSTFYGMEIGSRALTTNQIALDVVGQNIANINTPGYSRQVVDIQESDPFTPPDLNHTHPGALGTGVTAASITRVRDNYLDQQYRDANSQQAALNNISDTLGQVQSAFNEPSTSGLGAQMTNFFNSFSDLSSNPQSDAVRSTVVNQAQSVVSMFHSVSTSLSQIAPNLQTNITDNINNANNIAQQIASLNHTIRFSVAAGDHPNDLEDQRDNLVDQLSQIADVQVVEVRDPQSNQDTGEVNVNVGGYALVQGDTANALPTQVTTSNGVLGLVTPSNDTIPLNGGNLYGLIKATTLVSGYLKNLDSLASQFITSVNAQHSLGVGLDGQSGRNFFTGNNAATIAVSSTITSNLDTIAAAAAPAPPNTFAPGNGDNATALAALSTTQVINGFSLTDYYNSSIAQIGADTQSYQNQANTQQSVVSQVQNQQQSVSGVNLDEELTKMLQYQRSYQAAARVINVMDACVDQIISSLGSTAATGG